MFSEWLTQSVTAYFCFPSSPTPSPLSVSNMMPACYSKNHSLWQLSWRTRFHYPIFVQWPFSFILRSVHWKSYSIQCIIYNNRCGHYLQNKPMNVYPLVLSFIHSTIFHSTPFFFFLLQKKHNCTRAAKQHAEWDRDGEKKGTEQNGGEKCLTKLSVAIVFWPAKSLSISMLLSWTTSHRSTPSTSWFFKPMYPVAVAPDQPLCFN